MPKINAGLRLVRNDAGIYEVRWVEAGRSKRVSTRTADPAAAADFLAAWRTGLEREADEAQARTVQGVMDAYFAEHITRHVVAQGTAEIARRHLVAHFGPMVPADIRKATVRTYEHLRNLGEIGQPAGASTVRRELTVLVAALNHAVAEGRLGRGDVPHISLPESAPPRTRWLSDDEMARLFAAAAADRPGGRLSRAERWLHLAYYTGRRKAAIEGLTWDRVDFQTGVVDFDEPGRKITRKQRGATYMSTKLRACLERAHRERGEDCIYVLDHRGCTRDALAAVAKRAGVEGLTPHVLKHTCITHMLRRGVSIWDTAGAVATSPNTIQKVYGKHVPEAHKRAMEVL